ncbi:MAG: hypothetical protein GX581_00890 [Syntrophomonadaceae bacterium]|jgi:hypothetical protein|nr:hypothetical protein [Syntrophomonadaceae bacterium]
MANFEGMKESEIYQQVYNWYQESGLGRLQDMGKDWDAEYRQRSADLIKSLPEPEEAVPEDWYFVFQMISSDLLEWASKETDARGISMGEYARYALQKKEEEVGFDELFDFLRKSRLFKEFSRVF